jgi:hypothetical protein
MVEIIDCQQNSPEWSRARLGIPTASKFATVMAKGQGKTRSEYMRKLAGEIITGEPMDSFSNHHMERGHEMEAEARELYAFMHDCEPQLVGFVRNGPKGCSPDSLVDTDGLVEIKTKSPHILIECFERGHVCPPEHVAQCQGALWVAEREWIDFVAYWPRMPLFVVRVTRDKDYIANLSGEVDRFNDELAMLVDRIRAYGGEAVLRDQLQASLVAA